jgi:hypothetical protein
MSRGDDYKSEIRRQGLENEDRCGEKDGWTMISEFLDERCIVLISGRVLAFYLDVLGLGLGGG